VKHLILLLAGFAGGSSAFAQWAVVDVANLSQSVSNYGAMVQQIAKQGEQIANQVRQIQQTEDQLKRLGRMSDFKDLAGFSEFKLDLNLPTRIRAWAENATQIDGVGIFGDTRGGIFRPITNEFPNFDGGTIVREGDPYKPAQEITAKVDEFKSVQADVYARREELRKAIARTSDALQAAETDAEEQKLSAVLNAQYNQLAAVDSEVGLSAAEIQVRAAESAAMTTAQNEADAEARGKLAQKEAAKITTTFTPRYKCLLQFVTEKPLSP
jgi:type IV secretion system protein TrbJ